MLGKPNKQVCFRKLLTEKTKTVENCTCFISFCFLRLAVFNVIHDMFSCTDNEIAIVVVRFLFILSDFSNVVCLIRNRKWILTNDKKQKKSHVKTYH